jgi:hypothetical protein
MASKQVTIGFKNRKPRSFSSITEAVQYLAEITGTYYSWPEKNGRKQLENLVSRVPSVVYVDVER